MARSDSYHTRDRFEKLLSPVLPSLYGMALRLTRDPDEAEDLVQQACLRGYRFFHTFAPDTNFKAWMFKILTNQFINSYHRQTRERQASEVLDEPNHYERFVGQGTSRLGRTPEEEVVDIMMSQDIEAALAEIPAEFRMAVVLCDVEGLSYKEIAEIMGCPIGTVMSRLYRGRRALQKRLYHHAVERGLVSAPTADDGDGKVANLDDYRRKRN